RDPRAALTAMQRPRSSRFRSPFGVTAKPSELHRRILPIGALTGPARLSSWEPSLPEKQRPNHAPGSHIGFAIRQLAQLGWNGRLDAAHDHKRRVARRVAEEGEPSGSLKRDHAFGATRSIPASSLRLSTSRKIEATASTFPPRR